MSKGVLCSGGVCPAGGLCAGGGLCQGDLPYGCVRAVHPTGMYSCQSDFFLQISVNLTDLSIH